MKNPARSASVPPPVGGWDTRNALADMPVENAITLDNWFPSTDKVTVRNGFASHATGMTGDVASLMEYTPLDGDGELYAIANGSIYNATSAGAVGAAVVSGLSNSKFQHVQIGTAGGQFLIAMNGADTPQLYDGSSWANTSFTGPTVANLIWCNLHQRRLWFGETNSLTAWYLAVNSISGAASSFSLAGVAKLGGYIMAMGTWTRDAGDGADDVAVFLTSEGEAIVYQGTDPSSASTWALTGVFRIGKPIGRRCLIKVGADLVMVTEDGLVAASQILMLDRSRSDLAAISRTINKAFNDAVRDYGSNFGWEPFLYPKGTMLIVNVPLTGETSHQYVFNTITQAACRFTGIPAQCWSLLNDSPYFGGLGDGVVYKFDTGNADAGSAIEADAVQAFTAFGSPGMNKRFTLVEPLFQSNGNPNAALDLNTDYQVRAASGVSSASAGGGSKWGIAKWGIGTWGSANQIYRGWRGMRGIGRTASIRVRVSTTTNAPSWLATNWLYTPGGPL